jgi:hypothetical protein
VVGLLVGLLLVVVLVGLKRIDTGVQRGKGGEYLGVGTGIGRGHLLVLVCAGVLLCCCVHQHKLVLVCCCVVVLLCAPAQI